MAQVVQEQSLKKQLTIWFRKNEKLLWVVLLVVICFSFGMTGVMEMVIGDQARSAVFACDGRTYTWHDVRTLKDSLLDVGNMSPALDWRRLILNDTGQDETKIKDVYRDLMYPFMAAVAEADRLGLEVPRSRMFEITRELYRQHAASDKISSDPGYRKLSREKQNELFKEAYDAAQWTEQDYQKWLRGRGYAVPDFEHILGLILKVQSLRSFFINSDVTSRKDLYSAYVRENRKVTLEIARLDAEQLLPSVSQEYKEEEMRKYYNENTAKFFPPHRARFTYLKVPATHFDEQVTPTEADLRRRYESDKMSKYLAHPLGQTPVVDYPLTPEEQVKAAETMFKPFAEVKDAVKSDYVKSEASSKSYTLAREISKLLNPPPQPPPPAGQPAPEPVKAKTPQEIVAQYPFLTVGETEFFSKNDAEKVLGEFHSANQVNTWLKDVGDGKPLSPPISFLKSKDGATLFFVCNVEGKKGEQQTYENSIPEIKKAMNMGKAVEAALAKASAAIAEIRAGKDAATALPGARVDLAGPYAFGDCVNEQMLANPWQYARYNITRAQVMQFAVKAGTIKTGADTLPRAIETDIVRQVFSDMKVEEKVLPSPIEDRENSRCYVVRIAKEELPDAGGLTKDKEDELRMRLEAERQSDRAGAQWPGYLHTLVTEHVKDMLQAQ